MSLQFRLSLYYCVLVDLFEKVIRQGKLQDEGFVLVLTKQALKLT